MQKKRDEDYLDDDRLLSEPSLISNLIHFIKTESFHILGFPSGLEHKINKGNLKPQEIQNCVDTFWLRSVPAWHEWLQDGSSSEFDYRAPEPDRFGRVVKHVPALERLISQEVFEGFSCDIRDIGGLAASKSSDLDLISIEELPLHYRDLDPSFLFPVTEEHFHLNMRHGQIRLDDMRFSYFPWAPRKLYWDNNGGSHHFAAAHYQSSLLGLPFRLNGQLTKYRVNASAVTELCSHWLMFVMPSNDESGGFYKAMKSFRCPYGRTNLPLNLDADNYGKNRKAVVFLAQDELRPRRVAALLAKAGYPSFNVILKDLVVESQEH
jgi:hypothetical protein